MPVSGGTGVVLMDAFPSLIDVAQYAADPSVDILATNVAPGNGARRDCDWARAQLAAMIYVGGYG